MFENIVTFLNRKYPFHLISIKSAIFISLSIGGIILLFEPFGFIDYEGNKILASFGFAVVSFFCIFLKSFFIKRILKNREKKWTIINEILSLTFGLIIISIGNYIYMSIIIPVYSLSIINFIKSVFITFSIGVIIVSFVVLYRYNIILNNKLGSLITSDIKEDDSNQTITFTSTNKTEDDFTILKKDFLFVESIRNNIHIYYYDSNMSVRTTSIRNTLKNVEGWLSDEFIKRCHRSFLVNVAKVQKYTGNSNGYRIYFKNYNNFVPVSRSYSHLFKVH